jgi:hypothetical protein
MRRLMAIDSRQLAALPNTMIGRATPDVVHDLEQIAADYEALLGWGLPRVPFYTEKALRLKIADTLSMAAQASEAIRNQVKVQQLNESAATAYRAAGEDEKAKQCEAAISQKVIARAGNLDAEIRTLSQELAKVSPGELAAAEKLIDLALLYHRNGEDLEALPRLEEAQRILDSNGGMEGGDLANALTNSLLGVFEGNHRGGPTPIGESMRARGLYRVLYRTYAGIYDKTDPDKAAAYRAKEAKFDSREENEEFSTAMLRALQGKLGKL